LESALGLVAERLLGLKERYGPQAVAFPLGEAGLNTEYGTQMRRLARVFGSPNFSHAGSHCFVAKEMAWTYTMGSLPAPDIQRTGCVLLWGANPTRSCPPTARAISEARGRGAKLMVIDPVRTALAREADIHLQVHPGADATLALGLIGVLVREGLHDAAFCERFGRGFDRLVGKALALAPEDVEAATGVPAGLMADAARLYAGSGPACVLQGVALDHHVDAFQLGRAVACLLAAGGNLGRQGGMLFRPPLSLAPLKASREPLPRPAAEPLGLRDYPLYVEHTRTAQANVYASTVLTGEPYPLQGLLVSSGNPALSWPGSREVRRALEALELLVVVDQFMTDTARFADIVIPAAFFLEFDQLLDRFSLSAQPVLELGRAVCPPAPGFGEWDFWLRLAHQLGYAQEFPWRSEREAMDVKLAGLDLTTDDLEALGPVGFRYGEPMELSPEAADPGGAAPAAAVLSTPSGRVEFYSDRLAERGFDPLPGPGSPLSADRQRFPFTLIAGPRLLPYMHTRFRDIPPLRRLEPEPRLLVNPLDAAAEGVHEGEMVLVESPHGGIRLPVSLSDVVAPGVMATSHGWSEKNVNLLSTAEELDPVSGFPCYRSLPVRIEHI
jgi:anaerobic selenocysteine-containing dehydrogenase